VPSRRDEIIDLARTLFAERGYSVTSMRDLAEVAGLQPGSLYAHFKSKAEIVAELMQHFFGELLPVQQAAHDGPGNGAARLAEMIAVVFDVCQRNEAEIRIIHHEWKTLIHLDELAPMIEPSVAVLDLWRNVVVEGIEDGSIKPLVDPEYMVRAITHSIHGILDAGRYENRSAPSEELTPVEFLQLTFLSGIATRSPAAVTAISRRHSAAARASAAADGAGRTRAAAR
jgi:AcrR family transcriptional regulator